MKKSLAILVALIALGVALSAQDLPKAKAFGLTGQFGYSNSSIGCWYNLTDKIVLRPSIGYTWVKSGSDRAYDTYDYTYDYQSNGVNVGVDAFYQLPIAGNLVLGVGPGVRYSFSTSKSTNEDDYDTYTNTNTSQDISNTVTFTAKASAQYFLSKNLCAFLDLGIYADVSSSKGKSKDEQYMKATDTTTTTSSNSGKGHSYDFGFTTACIGVAYLF
jgi:hypothetical protein